jgi:hypothetical protein
MEDWLAVGDYPHHDLNVNIMPDTLDVAETTVTVGSDNLSNGRG